MLLPTAAFLIYLWLNFLKAPKDFFLKLALSIVSLVAVPIAMFVLYFMVMFFFELIFRR